MFEINILIYIQNYLRNDLLTPLMRMITYSGNNGYIWILIGVLLCINKKKRYVGILIFIVLLEVLLFNNLLIKNYVARFRPFETYNSLQLLISQPSGYSFMSGHSASSFASAIIIFKFMKKRIGIIAIIYASLVAFSRIYFGVHYPSDIIMGTLFGIFLSLVTIYIYEKYKNSKLV